MLKSFRLANHRSFLEEQELVLIPSAPGRDHEVQTVAAIYGANASGKSNLVDGLSFMSRAVRRSFSNWGVDEGVPRDPFRVGAGGRPLPSTFVVELVLLGVPHTYGFSVDDAKVLEEWLYIYPEKRKRILFERTASDTKFGTTVGNLKSKLELLGELTRPNALFLSLAAQSNLTALMPVHLWFRSLTFRSGSSAAVRNSVLTKRTLDYVTRTSKAELFERLLTAADTGISEVFVSQGLDPDHPDGSPRQTLLFLHGSGEPLKIEDESDGTRNWIALLPSVLETLDGGSTLVVDEIDASLHPLLTIRLIDLFANEETNPNRAQLIFTTHDTTPLGSYVGREVLQRDQVWFVEKDPGGQSRLYPLTDFKPRIGENAEKRYLGGSYGAVPVLNDLDFDRAVEH
jgi:hypothetical protein